MRPGLVGLPLAPRSRRHGPPARTADTPAASKLVNKPDSARPTRTCPPDAGLALAGNRDEGIRIYDPRSDEERVEVAQTCAVRLDIEMPVLLDGIDNRVASAYGALPDRLYLIGKDGRVAFQGEKGPQGFKSEELEAAIREELEKLP